MNNRKKYSSGLIAWKITKECTLKCLHCRANTEKISNRKELLLNDIHKIIDHTAADFNPVIILTGCEPVLNKNIFDIIQYGNKKGLKMVLETCGHTLNPSILNRLKRSGISQLSFSIEGSTSKTHDMHRGLQGSFESALNGMKYSRLAGVPFRINTTVTRKNMTELPSILKLAVHEKAVSFHPFFLTQSGTAKSSSDLYLSHLEYEFTLNWIYDQSSNIEIECTPSRAPLYYSIFRQKENKKNRVTAASS
jgi:AdoMet-dependent heme synthase